MKIISSEADTKFINKSNDLIDKISKGVESGTVRLSSSDIAAQDNQPTISKPNADDKITVDVPDAAKNDKLINDAAAAANLSQTIDGFAHLAYNYEDSKFKLPDKVEISKTEKEAFITALIKNDRMYLPFSIFNGAIFGVFRSRTQSESYAILTYINTEILEKRIETFLDYTTLLRNLLLTAQVSELNGVKYPEMTEPLLRTIENGKIIEPGWVNQCKIWNEKNEGLVSAIYRELQIFERKYWAMVDNAADQNFWNPAAST